MMILRYAGPGAALAVFLMTGVPDRLLGQAPKPHSHEHAQQGMSCSSEAMGGPHHALAMAYWQNMATFARALEKEAAPHETLDLEMARAAVAEMRRNFDAIRQHHHAHMAMMAAESSNHMKSHMDSALASIERHLAALEADVHGPKPDPAKVREHAAGIVEHCREAGPPAKSRPHHL